MDLDNQKKLEGEPLLNKKEVEMTTAKPATSAPPKVIHPSGIMPKDYNPYVSPPDHEICKVHGQAKLAGDVIGLFDLQDKKTEYLFYEEELDEMREKPEYMCPCCSRKTNMQMIKLGIETDYLVKLGTAIPGYFIHANFIIYSLLIMTAVYSIYGLYTIFTGTGCKYGDGQPLCGSRWKFFLSVGNRSRDVPVDVIERGLAALAFVLVFVLRIGYFKKMKKLEDGITDYITDITDYSIEMTNLPKDISKKDIEEWFKKVKLDNGQEVSAKVELIDLAYKDIPLIDKHEESIQKTIESYVKLMSEKDNAEDKDLVKLEADFSGIVKNVEKDLKEKFTSGGPGFSKNFTGTAFISFNKQEEAAAVKEKLCLRGTALGVHQFFGFLPACCRKTPGARIFKLRGKDQESKVVCLPSPFPGEIQYDHLGVTPLNRIFRSSFSLFVSILIIVLTFVIILWLKSYQASLPPSKASILVIVITISIKVVAFLYSFLSVKLVDFEMLTTITSINIGIIWRNNINVFLNSVLLLVATNFIVAPALLKSNIFKDVGLINDLLFLLIFTVGQPISSFFEPSYFISLAKQWWYKRKGEANIQMQYQENRLYEGAVWDYPRRFGKYLTVMLLACFFISVFPLAPVISLLIVVLSYYSDKLYLLRLAKDPAVNTMALPLSMLRFSDLYFVAWGLGYLIFDVIIYGQTHSFSWIFFIVTFGVFLVNPNQWLAWIFTYPPPEAETDNYPLKSFLEKVKTRTYRSTNPVEKLKSKMDLYKREGFLQECRTNPSKYFEDVDGDDDDQDEAEGDTKQIEEVWSDEEAEDPKPKPQEGSKPLN